MDEPDSMRMFQGTELPRLLVLLVIMVVGWALVWHFVMKPGAPAEVEPELVISGKPVAVEVDPSPEFETVVDKKGITFRDMSAYEMLLNRARDATPADLAARARRDVFFTHLWEDPKTYRGIPVHLLGTARRVLYYKSKLSRTGWLYEAWVFTADGQNNPYVCVFEEAPKGFPVGASVSERVVFNGYFLKLLRYEAGDTPRASPFLIGRLGWTPRPGDAGAGSRRSVYWLAGGVGLMFVFSLIRWIVQLRRSFRPRPRPSLLRDRPNEEIAPEALSDWLESVPHDDESTPTREAGH